MAAPGLTILTPDTMIPVLSNCQYQKVALESILELYLNPPIRKREELGPPQTGLEDGPICIW